MRTTIEFLVEAWRLGLPEITDHPAPADSRPSDSSCWHLPSMVRFARMPGVHLLRIDKCMFGLRAKKPTSLLGISVPMMCQLLRDLPHQGKCQHCAHIFIRDNRDVGRRNKDARFYPSPLSRFLAMSVFASVRE
eukprot:722954-Pyramimonas_sp.AAC.1